MWAMIVTLTGDNTFALQTELTNRVSSFVAEHGDLALERIDGQEASIEQMSEAINSLPFLASKKMVVLREPSKQKVFTEQASDILAEVSDTTDVIIVEPKLDKRQKYYDFLRKNTDFELFAALDAPALARWLVASAKDQKGELNMADATYLIDRVGLNQLMLSNELQKLLIYNPKITRTTIDLLVEPTPQSTIFQLIEAAFAGKTQYALQLYDEQRALKVEPQQITALLAWQLHVLALIKTAEDRSAEEIAKEAKLNTYVVRKSQALARKLTLAQLRSFVKNLMEIDAASKNTNQNTDDALKLFIIELAQ